MELVLVVTAAALIGATVRYLVPGRDRHGLIALPALQVALASVLFVGVMWLGLAPESLWAWLIALVVSTGAHVALALWLPGARDRADEQLLAELTNPASPMPQDPGAK